MKLLKKGSQGEDVIAWQLFLIGRGLLLVADGDFGNVTTRQTKAFQKRHRLGVDGKVGNRTLARAMSYGFGVVEEPPAPKPTHLKPLTVAQRRKLFGSFRFDAAPTRRSPEAIKILDGWARKHIVRVELPGLERSARFHYAVAQQAVGLFEAWGCAGLLDRVKTFNGSYVPRYVRGSTKTLSNHSWGTAFDINARLGNRLGMVPALKGEPGSVRELVPLANEFGFYWGGHFRHRRDGMHFECVKIL